MNKSFTEELSTVFSLIEEAKELYTKAKDIFDDDPNKAVEYIRESDRLITEYAERYHSAVMKWENPKCKRVIEEVYVTDSNGSRFLDRTVVKYVRDDSSDSPLGHKYQDSVDVFYN